MLSSTVLAADQIERALLRQMATDELLDMTALLAPIEGDCPSGADLRWESIYDEIRAARRGNEESEPDPQKVLTLTSEAISSRSKDLQLAAYLTEALVQLHGFAGLRDGFHLTTELLENFWETLYPRPDDEASDDERLEPRAAPLFFLTESDRASMLPNRLRLAPLLRGSNGTTYSLEFYESRTPPPLRDGEDESAHQDRTAKAAAQATEFDGALAASPSEELTSTCADLQKCLDHLKRFEEVANQRFGIHAAPGTSALRKPLESGLQVLERTLRSRSPEEGAESEDFADCNDSQRQDSTERGRRTRAHTVSRRRPHSARCGCRLFSKDGASQPDLTPG